MNWIWVVIDFPTVLTQNPKCGFARDGVLLISPANLICIQQPEITLTLTLCLTIMTAQQDSVCMSSFLTTHGGRNMNIYLVL